MYSYIIIILWLLLPLQANEEKRAIWVVRDALHSRESIDNIISTAVSAKITDLFVQVRALGRTYYHSSVERWAPGVDRSFDPLSVVLEKAQRYGMRVHAWINVFYIWASDVDPDSSHVFIRQKEAVLRNQAFPTYATLKKNGVEGFFLDPSHESVQNHILAIVTELINNYELDGIHYDYYRYPGIEYSFTPKNRTDFRIRHYFDPFSIYYSNLFHEPKGFHVLRHADSLYRSHLMEILTEFLTTTFYRIKEKNNAISLSIAVKPDPVQAKLRYFQNWTDWLDQGICDFVVIMNYRTNWQDFINILSIIKEYAVDDRVMVGISTYNQNEKAVRRRISYVQSGQFYGFSLFSYNHLVKNKSYLYKLLL
jgi:uncharacterized lipoprotein YddW (UPF0748 family)